MKLLIPIATGYQARVASFETSFLEEVDYPFRRIMVNNFNTFFSGNLSSHQKLLLQRVKESLKTGGYGKEELYLHSDRYVLTTRFSVFKSQLRKNPLMDVVDLALLLFGTRDIALSILTRQHFELRGALGPDVVADIFGKSF